jgi:outer membrane receptor protein involved in Fe transport
VSLLWRHIDGTVYEGQAADFAARGFAATGRNLFNGTLPASAGSLAGTQENFTTIGSADYFDLTARVNVNDNLTIVGSVQNLFNSEPPLVGGEAGSTSFNSGNTFPSTYDSLGRRYVLSAKIRF